MQPSVGRIVLVRSPAFMGECPAIVTAVYLDDHGTPGNLINCRVFTNHDGDGCPLITGLDIQGESSLGWGWRWPPRYEAPRVIRELTAEEARLLTKQRPGSLVEAYRPSQMDDQPREIIPREVQNRPLPTTIETPLLDQLDAEEKARAAGLPGFSEDAGR